MTFDGCNNFLFKTLLLSGNDKKSMKEVKSLLKHEIFSTAREYFLQKKMLYFLFCKIPYPLSQSNKEKTSNNIIENKNSNTKVINGLSRHSLMIKESNSMNTNKLLKDQKKEDYEIENKIKRKGSDNNEYKKSKNNNISTISNNSIINKDLNNKDSYNLKPMPFVNNIYNKIQENNLHLLNKSNLSIIRNNSLKENEEKIFVFESDQSKNSESELNSDIKKIRATFSEKNSIKYKNNDSAIDNQINALENKSPNSFFGMSDKNIKPISEDIGKNIYLWGQTKINQMNHYASTTKKVRNNSNYKYGFDISPIITNKTSFQIIRLTMCKPESKVNMNNSTSNSEN